MPCLQWPGVNNAMRPVSNAEMRVSLVLLAAPEFKIWSIDYEGLSYSGRISEELFSSIGTSLGLSPRQ